MNGKNKILTKMELLGWSAENIVFGMGGGLLQKVNRDTQRSAFKCSAQQRNGQWYDIFKDPIDTSKTSKKGRLYLTCYNGKFNTTNIPTNDDLLQTIFLNGKLIKDYTFDEILKHN